MTRRDRPITQAERDQWRSALRAIYGHYLMLGFKVTVYPPGWARGALRCGVKHWRTV